jgi:hypothetical protein
VPEQMRDTRQVIRGQLAAYAGTADPLAIHLKGGSILHTEAMLLPGSSQCLIITASVTAKTEIITDNQMLNT